MQDSTCHDDVNTILSIRVASVACKVETRINVRYPDGIIEIRWVWYVGIMQYIHAEYRIPCALSTVLFAVPFLSGAGI